MRSSDPLDSVDLLVARRDWLVLLQAVSTGKSVLITSGGRPIAQLGPPSAEPQSAEPPLVRDQETANLCAALARLYGPALLSSILGVSPARLRALRQNGLTDEPLFDRLVFLERLACVIFSKGAKRRGSKWLTSPHPTLRGHSPALVLQRPQTEQEQQVMTLARQAFERQLSR